MVQQWTFKFHSSAVCRDVATAVFLFATFSTYGMDKRPVSGHLVSESSVTCSASSIDGRDTIHHILMEFLNCAGLILMSGIFAFHLNINSSAS
jgi:hypothetical protein